MGGIIRKSGKLNEQYSYKRLGYLTPASINSEIDSVKVSEARKALKIPIYSEPTYKEQQQNQENYIKSEKDLSIGTYVYRDFNEKLFDKSFDVSVSLIFTRFNII